VKAIMCKCGHARRHHCRKKAWKGDYWYGHCYHPIDEVRKDYSKKDCNLICLGIPKDARSEIRFTYSSVDGNIT